METVMTPVSYTIQISREKFAKIVEAIEYTLNQRAAYAATSGTSYRDFCEKEHGLITEHDYFKRHLTLDEVAHKYLLQELKGLFPKEETFEEKASREAQEVLKFCSEAIDATLEHKGRIQALKLVRRLVPRWSLKEAKNFVDNRKDELKELRTPNKDFLNDTV